MSNGRGDVRDILLDVADNITREPDLMTRIGLVDEFMEVAVKAATDLRDHACYDLMQAKITHHNEAALPHWAMRRWQYASRWGNRFGLPMKWKNRVGRPKNEGPDMYMQIRLPESPVPSEPPDQPLPPRCRRD
jgi:hypothetical protein